MSSLAAARADNFYYPPEWTPQMGGISKFQGSKGKNQYEQYGIIRFELPFDAWCLGCGIHMTKGLRFNAKKEKEGKYFTTQIWSFTMKCFSCEQRFKIVTDPKNATYDMAEGIRKHEQDFTPDVDDSLIVATSDETRQLIATDPMFRLQHNEEDKIKVLSAKERMEALIDVQYAHHKDYYDANSLLRSRNRKRKKRDIELKKEGAAMGLSMPLVEPSQKDAEAAKQVVFTKRSVSDNFAITERNRKSNIQAQSIFDRPPSNEKSGVNAADGGRVGLSGSSHIGSHNHHKESNQKKVAQSESRLVVYGATGNRPASASVSAGAGVKSELDGAGRYSATARLLSKANARQIDPRALKIAGPTATRPAEGVAGFGVPAARVGSTEASRGVKKVVVSARPIKPVLKESAAAAKGVESQEATTATTGATDGMAGKAAVDGGLLDLLADYS